MRGLSLDRVCWRRAFRPLLRPLPRSRPLPLALRRCASTEEKLWPAERKKVVDFPTIDAKWQARWKENDSSHDFENGTKGKAYILPMFPYPSGTLHLGHLRVYTISDVLARFKQMQGYRVTHPIGWDAFGLPAENAAIERGIPPDEWTLSNIDAMKKQMMVMGGRWNWEMELRTCDPSFYKQTQRIFLMLYDRGLAYQAESLVNWDPVDRTVLANEQVDANGCSWRSGAKVEKKMLRQWFLRIKEFQEPLLNDLDTLAENGNWPERVLAMQRNWLGKSEGTKLSFEVRSNAQFESSSVEVYTTRADTLFGVQYIALSLNHPIVQATAKEDESLRAFIDQAQNLPQDSKAGYLLQGVTARNPLSTIMERLDHDMPVYVAPYVLGDYGSGAVMGVPGHDARDHAFWRANAGHAPIRMVVTSEPGIDVGHLLSEGGNDKPMLEKGFIAPDIPGFGGLGSDEAMGEIIQRLQKAGVSVEKTENWRLRDWLISRQRYWGTPIPIIHCDHCGPVPVPVEDLPVELPQLPAEHFKRKSGNPLAEHSVWKKTKCPNCGSHAERESDTMDTFMDSSWYYFRFLSTTYATSPIKPLKADEHMPVDVYIGGVEHAILHLLYARFIAKFLATTDQWPEGAKVKGEPFKKLITQGMVHGKTYSDPDTGRFLRPEEVGLRQGNTPIVLSTGKTANVSFEKMSKSKYNGVDPGMTIATHGADVTRAHMLFQAPVGDVLEWDEAKITGVQRWLTRLVNYSRVTFMPPNLVKDFMSPHKIDRPLLDILSELHDQGTPVLAKGSSAPQYKSLEEARIAGMDPEEQALWSKMQETIASVTKSYSETYSLNTIVSDLMTLTNVLWDSPHTSDTMAHLKYYSLTHLLRMVAPIAPATAEECWELLHSITNANVRSDPNHPLQSYGDPSGSGGPSIFAFGFPEADLDIIPVLNTTMTCVFQIDGKRKFEVNIKKVPAQIPDTNINELGSHVLEQLMETEQGKEWLKKETGTLWSISGTGESHNDYPQIPKGWNVIFPRRGRLVNVVSPKLLKSKKRSPSFSIEHKLANPNSKAGEKTTS